MQNCNILKKIGTHWAPKVAYERLARAVAFPSQTKANPFCKGVRMGLAM
jgi:hypothetical protein